MRKPLSRNYLVARKMLVGAADPAGLKMQYEVDGNCVMSDIRPLNHRQGHVSLCSTGFIADVVEDAAHAGLAGLEQHIGLLREINLKHLKPVYAKDHFRIDVTRVPHVSQNDIRKLRIRLVNPRDQICVEGTCQLYCLSKAQFERMFPNHPIPSELRHYLPG